MTAEEIQVQIDGILQALVSNPASDVVEYTVNGNHFKKARSVMYEDLKFWRGELQRINRPAKTVYTRF